MTEPPEPDEPTLRPPRTVENPAPGEGVFTRQGHAWSEISQLSETSFRMRLGGLFETAWLTALCNGLASHRISVDHAHALRGHDSSWIAELHVIALRGATDPLSLPLLEFAQFTTKDRTGNEYRLDLDTLRIIDSPSHGGTLVLTVEAADALGLLAALLGVIGQLPLTPIELHIETRAGRVYDSLWLTAEEGRRPSDDARRDLEHLLSPYVRP